MSTDYLSAAETAKIIRRALTDAFPNVKFYVRSDSYSGGASIDVFYDGLAGYERLSACHCHNGPTIEAGSPNYCTKCHYTGRIEAIYKPGMPSVQAVRSITDHFSGRGFDGMIDLAYHIDAYVDRDLRVLGTRSSGTGGSRGSVPAWDDAPDRYDRVVSFGSDSVYVRAELPYDIAHK